MTPSSWVHIVSFHQCLKFVRDHYFPAFIPGIFNLFSKVDNFNNLKLCVGFNPLGTLDEKILDYLFSSSRSCVANVELYRGSYPLIFNFYLNTAMVHWLSPPILDFLELILLIIIPDPFL